MSDSGRYPGTENEAKGVHLPVMNTSNPLDVMNCVFATERPKHLIQGLADAAHNVTVGVSLGLGAFVAAPVAARNGGPREWAKGLGMAVAGCIGMSAYGVGTGVYQLARGVLHTHEAVKETWKGKRFWDSSEERWVLVRLTEFFAELPVTDNDIIAEARNLFREICEKPEKLQSDAHSIAATDEGPNSLYSILNVSKTATTAEIRLAFRKKAVQLHPDKNLNDPDATIHFQKLQEAYAVLSNEDRRHQYDTEGKVEETNTTNVSYTMFEEVFGAQFLQPFIGRISWALYFIPNAYFDEKTRKEFQRRRTLRIAKFLAHYLDGDAPIEEIFPLINDAVSTRLGPKIMSVVADQYATAARQHLYSNGIMHEVDSFVSSKVAKVSHIATTCGTGIKGLVNSFSDDVSMKFMFSIAEPDVRRSVLRACRYLLYDISASTDKRWQRALSLERLSDYIRQEVTKVKEERKNLLLN